MRESTKILKCVISKGGLFAYGAKQYINDKDLSSQFIVELSEQCHVTAAREHWGEDLTNMIITFAASLKKT